MSHISSYPSILNVGHRDLEHIFDDPVLVEEKIDGSQISFSLINGSLALRSKGQQLNLDNPDRMFAKAIEVVKSIQDKLVPDWIYRGEYLLSQHHNVINYSRIPRNHIIIYDIDDGQNRYLPYSEKLAVASQLGWEVAPLLYLGKIESAEQLIKFLDQDSILGGSKIEGIVCKNYHRLGRNGEIMLAKFVNAKFREVHEGTIKANNQGDILAQLIMQLKTEARFLKAVQHLNEAGQLEFSAKDIGKLVAEVPADIEKECKELIMDALYEYYWPKIRRGIIAAIPEFYKSYLLERSLPHD